MTAPRGSLPTPLLSLRVTDAQYVGFCAGSFVGCLFIVNFIQTRHIPYEMAYKYITQITIQRPNMLHAIYFVTLKY